MNTNLPKIFTAPAGYENLLPQANYAIKRALLANNHVKQRLERDINI
jgi:hypothetical protein